MAAEHDDYSAAELVSVDQGGDDAPEISCYQVVRQRFDKRGERAIVAGR
jgi:hypothetical protein